MCKPEVLNAQEAAEFLRVNPYTIRAKAREGVLPGAKIGKEWRFSRRALLVFIEGDSVRSGAFSGAASAARSGAMESKAELEEKP